MYTYTRVSLYICICISYVKVMLCTMMDTSKLFFIHSFLFNPEYLYKYRYAFTIKSKRTFYATLECRLLSYKMEGETYVICRLECMYVSGCL